MLQRFISPVPLTLTVEVGGVTKKVTFARLRTGTGELVTDDEGVAEALRRHPYFNKILTVGETPTDGVLVGTVVDVVVEKSVEEQVAELRAKAPLVVMVTPSSEGDGFVADQIPAFVADALRAGRPVFYTIRLSLFAYSSSCISVDRQAATEIVVRFNDNGTKAVSLRHNYQGVTVFGL